MSADDVAAPAPEIRDFLEHLAKERDVSPKLERCLPAYLDRAQVDGLFKLAETRATTTGRFIDVRNLALLELLYSAGLRVSELHGVNRVDLDLVSQQVKVRGKGRKER